MLHSFAYAEIIFAHILVFPAFAIEVQHINENSPTIKCWQAKTRAKTWPQSYRFAFFLSFAKVQVQCMEYSKIWRKSYFCRSESNIIRGQKAFPLPVSCRSSNYQITLRSRSTFQNLENTMWLANWLSMGKECCQVGWAGVWGEGWKTSSPEKASVGG